jgi:type I restriction enzyme S subunit
VNFDWLYYWLLASQKDFVARATGTTFLAITANIVKEQILPLPPLAEQSRIVKAIDKAFQSLDVIFRYIN